MQAGRLNTPLTFEESVNVSNGAGGYETAWTPRFDRKAEFTVRPQSVNDDAQVGGHMTQVPDYLCKVRADDDTLQVRAGWRVKSLDGRVFAVRSAAFPDIRDNSISMVLQEGQPT
ncbi:head-tail adaptor protein [uncultured Tateyamaria sp.]|uniref:head-tail adaptor protein n=1 Tax=Tateyamaria sp. 1078 TaxID=3417464 RepID=UPI00262F5757|nr:head-tail adaptor protein [uncultured Tateyamaria sp.]